MSEQPRGQIPADSHVKTDYTVAAMVPIADPRSASGIRHSRRRSRTSDVYAAGKWPVGTFAATTVPSAASESQAGNRTNDRYCVAALKKGSSWVPQCRTTNKQVRAY